MYILRHILTAGDIARYTHDKNKWLVWNKAQIFGWLSIESISVVMMIPQRTTPFPSLFHSRPLRCQPLGTYSSTSRFEGS
ncbi:hypothetical protein VTJ04DRAFT_8750 [Mycothermus thermophilus]|uniref:uncharacterized protein n=1 Tax=Humicola insolens TaxID=85995 RepID=UPI0037440EA6